MPVEACSVGRRQRDSVTSHLTQQTDREVVRVPVRELVYRIERQRARQHHIRRRRFGPCAGHPILKANRFTGQPLQLVEFGEPGPRRGRERHHAPTGLLEQANERRQPLRRGRTADDEVQHSRRISSHFVRNPFTQGSGQPQDRRTSSQSTLPTCGRWRETLRKGWKACDFKTQSRQTQAPTRG